MDILKDAHNEIFYSIASMWEVSIKHNLNKLPLSGTEFMHYCEQAGFKKLEIDDRHIVALETLEVKKNRHDGRKSSCRLGVFVAAVCCLATANKVICGKH